VQVDEHEARLDAEEGLEDASNEWHLRETAYRASQHEVEDELHRLKHQLRVVETERDRLLKVGRHAAATNLNRIKVTHLTRDVVRSWHSRWQEVQLEVLRRKSVNLELSSREADLGSRIFRAMDQDGNRAVDVEELACSLGKLIAPHEVGLMHRILDKNEDNAISADEWCTYLRAKKQAMGSQRFGNFLKFVWGRLVSTRGAAIQALPAGTVALLTPQTAAKKRGIRAESILRPGRGCAR